MQQVAPVEFNDYLTTNYAEYTTTIATDACVLFMATETQNLDQNLIDPISGLDRSIAPLNVPWLLIGNREWVKSSR